ncbi:3-hydroxyacyl-CoA dehydrogenase family protein [Aquibium sp. LZ166]|uniref:3-hydroxyacyl-CoA dehydrogenase family protein n=1 Tax=Aquibium pacificus TaxID=3153579 RepID=A0ABV3SG22_9HYPH
MQSSNRISIVGAGFMGSVIATLYARYGYQVVLHDEDVSALDAYGERALPIVERLASAEHPADWILSNVTMERTLEAAVDGAFLVHEIVQEDLALKQHLFEKLDRVCEPDVVLATNTSSFLLTDICRRVRHRERVLGIHYVTPAHIVRAVEIIAAEFTPPALVDWGRTFLETIDHIGIACLERPGFLVNRIQFAMQSEIHRIMDEGLASREDIDAAVRLSLGPRLALWGPLLTEDLVASKKTALAVTDYLHQQTGDPNFASRPVLHKLVEDGRLGAASGKGWYEFDLDHASIVSRRDSQLQELLDWLRQKNAVQNIGIRSGSVANSL